MFYVFNESFKNMFVFYVFFYFFNVFCVSNVVFLLFLKHKRTKFQI